MDNNRSLKLLLVLILVVVFEALVFVAISPDLAARPAALTPRIAVQPSTTVEVGEEVLFDATGSTYDAPDLLRRARFEWDFGDDYVLKWDDPYYYSAESGIAALHFYMRPGNYTATLTVKVWSSYGGDDLPIGDPIAVETATMPITVTGQATQLPPWPDGNNAELDMRLDNNLTDSSPNHLTATWQGGTGGFVGGMAGQAANMTGGVYISVTDPSGVFSNLGALTISFWAKKNVADAYGYYLLDKPGQFSMDVPEARTLRVRITTPSGTATATSYFAYGVDNAHWHHYAATYDGSTVRLFIDGRELATAAQSGAVATSTSALLIGKRSTSTTVFNGVVDEVRIYSQALSSNDLFTGFDVWHAPFQARIAQYLYVQIPSAVYGDATNQLRMTLAGDTGYNVVLVDKSGLAAEEKVLLRNADLPAGNYVLTTQLLDAGDNVLDQIREKLAKPYAGAPQVGIDENNAFRVDGELFFPVTPWLLNTEYMASWKQNGYINALFAEGWYPQHDIASWTDYLTEADNNQLYVIGPGTWFDLGLPLALSPARRAHFARNADINVLAHYVTATRDLPALLEWMWQDEPDLGGRDYRVPPPVLGAWTYVSHQHDPQHPVGTNFVGYNYLPYYGTYGQDYDYLNSAPIYGGKKHFSIDVTGFDIYPLEYRVNVYLNNPTRGPIDLYVEAIDRHIAKNYSLIPAQSFVEVCDVELGETLTPGPTADQVRMEAWLNVVHGVKAINWFHYFEVGTIQYAAMAQFTDQVNRLAPAVLGPEPDIHVADSANAQANRVDTMVRYYDGAVYVFAVRLTEPDPVAGSLYTVPEPVTIAVDFLLDTSVSSLAEVVDEGRTVPVIDGEFSDTFARNAVHIYRIPLNALELRGRPGNGLIDLDWDVHVTLPATSTWRIDYTNGLASSGQITNIISSTRAYTLTGLTNYTWYTVTLAIDITPPLSDTVRAMPTDRLVYLPLVLR